MPEPYDGIFSEIGTFTITSCTFDGTVGRISASITVRGFTLSYTATYTYSPMP